jgi:hypothetical protein
VADARNKEIDPFCGHDHVRILCTDVSKMHGGEFSIDETLHFMFGLFKVSSIICLFHDETEAIKKFNE